MSSKKKKKYGDIPEYSIIYLTGKKKLRNFKAIPG